MRFALAIRPGVTRYVEADDIYYFEARRGDTLVRTRRRQLYRSVETLGAVQRGMTHPRFFRCHRSYIVNLDRVLELRRTGDRAYQIKLAPPVNVLLPLSRARLAAFEAAMAAG